MRGAQLAALMGSGGAAAPLFAAGGGMLDRATSEGAGFRNVIGAGVGGASGALAARGVNRIGSAVLNRGAQTAAEQVPGQAANQVGRSTAEHVAQMSSVSPAMAAVNAVDPGGGGFFGGIGKAIKGAPSFLAENPATLEFAGNMLSGRAEAGFREDQQQFYQDQLQLRREQDEHERSEEKMLRDMIIAGTWRTSRYA